MSKSRCEFQSEYRVKSQMRIISKLNLENRIEKTQKK